MAALKFFSLILLSGGLLMQPVLLQTASCCCARNSPSEATADSQGGPASTEGCPHCHVASTSVAGPTTVATLRTCTCQKRGAPTAVARTVKPTHAEMSVAAFEVCEHSVERRAGRSQTIPQNHPPGRAIPVRILKCSWLL